MYFGRPDGGSPISCVNFIQNMPCPTNIIIASTTESALAEAKQSMMRAYAMLFACFVMVALMLCALWYFVSTLKDIISTYQRHKSMARADVSVGPPPDDEPSYDSPKDNPSRIDPTDYIGTGESRFLKKVDWKYKAYNDLKTSYIKDTYNKRKNDDVINSDMLYGKNDDYDYNPPDDDT